MSARKDKTSSAAHARTARDTSASFGASASTPGSGASSMSASASTSAPAPAQDHFDLLIPFAFPKPTKLPVAKIRLALSAVTGTGGLVLLANLENLSDAGILNSIGSQIAFVVGCALVVVALWLAVHLTPRYKKQVVHTELTFAGEAVTIVYHGIDRHDGQGPHDELLELKPQTIQDVHWKEQGRTLTIIHTAQRQGSQTSRPSGEAAEERWTISANADRNALVNRFAQYSRDYLGSASWGQQPEQAPAAVGTAAGAGAATATDAAAAASAAASSTTRAAGIPDPNAGATNARAFTIESQERELAHKAEAKEDLVLHPEDYPALLELKMDKAKRRRAFLPYRIALIALVIITAIFFAADTDSIAEFLGISRITVATVYGNLGVVLVLADIIFLCYFLFSVKQDAKRQQVLIGSDRLVFYRNGPYYNDLTSDPCSIRSIDGYEVKHSWIVVRGKFQNDWLDSDDGYSRVRTGKCDKFKIARTVEGEELLTELLDRLMWN